MIKILLMIWVAVALFMTFIFCAAARRFVSEDPAGEATTPGKAQPPARKTSASHTSPASASPMKGDESRRLSLAGGWMQRTKTVTLSPKNPGQDIR